MQIASNRTQWVVDLEKCTACSPEGLVVHFKMLDKEQWLCDVECKDTSHPEWTMLQEREGDDALRRAMDPVLQAATQAYVSAHRRYRH